MVFSHSDHLILQYSCVFHCIITSSVLPSVTVSLFSAERSGSLLSLRTPVCRSTCVFLLIKAVLMSVLLRAAAWLLRRELFSLREMWTNDAAGFSSFCLCVRSAATRRHFGSLYLHWGKPVMLHTFICVFCACELIKAPVCDTICFYMPVYIVKLCCYQTRSTINNKVCVKTKIVGLVYFADVCVMSGCEWRALLCILTSAAAVVAFLWPCLLQHF